MLRVTVAPEVRKHLLQYPQNTEYDAILRFWLENHVYTKWAMGSLILTQKFEKKFLASTVPLFLKILRFPTKALTFLYFQYQIRVFHKISVRNSKTRRF